MVSPAPAAPTDVVPAPPGNATVVPERKTTFDTDVVEGIKVTKLFCPAVPAVAGFPPNPPAPPTPGRI